MGDLEPPKPARPLFLTFTDVTEEQLTHLATITSKGDIKHILHSCMNVDQSEGYRTEILKEFHFHNYSFCKTQRFNAEKTSTYLSIMKVMFEEVCLRRLTMDEAFNFFKGWLLKHSVQRPPFSVGVFTFEDVKAITEYVHNTFFRHYKLWKYAYVTHRDVELRVRADDLVPPAPQTRGLKGSNIVDPKEQPELRSMFEHAEALNQEMLLQQEALNTETKAERVKRLLESRIGDLMKNFDEQLKEQDERFMALVENK
eukprot:gnl/MRDRNA2_/MRDRNA2_62699_c0_seq1.p1 gnl/MRDRNA2_/MRDRNA2_62699_c0~~gnl/MRDRNA2_/MRDRNA2_62699_c0_seq1.p1  ORF type:complete len:256 (-),score=57.92 gnl/MRDRNA2_/MRDRNA2_62699_c0_seq1:49-816(-)